MKKTLGLSCLYLLLHLSSCEPSKNKDSAIDIVCTTGMIGDIAIQLVGDSLNVKSLMGPGVDPHLYKATQGDIKHLTGATVIIYNGLHLEGKMNSLFEKLKKQKVIINASQALSESELINSTDFSGAHDPHIWFNVALWSKVLTHVSEQLQQNYPNLKEIIQENESIYKQQLIALDSYCIEQIATIPIEQRIMITAHDAFKYFGAAYEIEVRGLQGISTTAELGLQDVSMLVQYVYDKKIKALFVESSVPQKSIEAVIEGCQSKGHNVVLGGELFSDAMGTAGTPEGNYIGMVKHNVSTIVNALK